MAERDIQFDAGIKRLAEHFMRHVPSDQWDEAMEDNCATLRREIGPLLESIVKVTTSTEMVQVGLAHKIGDLREEISKWQK